MAGRGQQWPNNNSKDNSNSNDNANSGMIGLLSWFNLSICCWVCFVLGGQVAINWQELSVGQILIQYDLVGGQEAWERAAEVIESNNERDLEPEFTTLRQQRSRRLLALLEHKVWGWVQTDTIQM